MNDNKLFENTIQTCRTNELVIQFAKQIISDMNSLNRILFKLEENFYTHSKNIILHEMSQEIDEDIRELINRINFNFNNISNAIINENQVEPLNKENMDNIMITIMSQYLFISSNIISNNTIDENYSKEINDIHTALANLANSINIYNDTIASLHNWPIIMTENESFSIAKQQINTHELPNNIG